MSPSKLSPEAEEGEQMLRDGVRTLKERIHKSREADEELPQPKKKPGRPKGSKNKRGG